MTFGSSPRATDPAVGIGLLDNRFRVFISGALHIETIADFPAVKELSRGRGGEYAAEIRSGFRELLRSREIGPQEWYGLTYVEFADDDTLYRFLGELYAYLYEGRVEPPSLPDDF